MEFMTIKEAAEKWNLSGTIWSLKRSVVGV